MRMYALYEQSRKVLALYIIVAALISVVALVSLNRGSVPDLTFRYQYSGHYWVDIQQTLATFKYREVVVWC